jgi:hypothetical protein
MTVLPTVRAQLVVAADELAAGRARPARPARIGTWLLAAASVAVVAAVVFAVARVHTHKPAPVPAATGAGGPGLVGVVLKPGQAWYVIAIAQQADPWRPPPSFNGVGPAGLVLTASTRAAVLSRTKSFSWTLPSGDGATRTTAVGKPAFIGSASERTAWRASGSRPLSSSTGRGYIQQAHGFEVGTATLTNDQLRRFPTDTAGVMRLFPARGPDPVRDQMQNMAAALEQVPLPAAARVAIFNALPRLHGVQHLANVRDPLGRSGTAFAVTEPGVAIHLPSVSGVLTVHELPQRHELIFNPRTDALLADETVLGGRTAIAGVGPGYPVSWTAYTTSKAVAASTAPHAPPPMCPGDATPLSLVSGVVPQTGEHAYDFRVTNGSGNRCAVAGYPKVNMGYDRRGRFVSLPFVYRHGGGPYVTRQTPRPVILAPSASAYFMLAKYRCDGKTLSAATELGVGHLGLGGTWGLDLASHHVDDLDYCSRYPGDARVDRGNYVYVSPLEPTISATAPSHP